MRKILPLILIALMLSGYTAYSKTDNTGGDKNIAVLNELGFKKLDTEKVSENMTRAQLAYLAYNLYSGGRELPEGGYQPTFSDVSVATPFFDYIEAAYDAGIMNGMGDGSFVPDGAVSTNDLTAVVLRAAGYGKVISEREDFLKTSKTADLFNGVITKDTAAVSLSEAVAVAVNALDIEVMTSDTEASDENNTVLNRKFGMYYKDGVFYSGRAIGKSDDNVMIDGRIYDTSFSPVYNNINGYKVRAYISLREDTVRFVDYSRFKNETYVLEAEDIISVSENRISFYNEYDRPDSISLSGITEIYNGVGVSYEANDFYFDNGRIVFIGENGSSYQTACIERYETMVVGAVVNETVYDFYDPMIRINLKNDKKFRIFFEGTKLEVSAVQKNDVLSIARTKDETEAYIYVSRKTLSGAVTAISEESFKVDRKTVYRTRYFASNEELFLGESVVIAFDYFGRAAALLSDTAESFKYGYLVKVLPDSEDEDIPKLKVYGADGEFRIYGLADKMSVNGKSVTNVTMNDVNEFTTAVKTSVLMVNGAREEKLMKDYVAQVIKFKTDKDGKINNLDTAIENPGEGGASLKLHGMAENTSFRGGANQLAFSYRIDALKTAAFYVPDSMLNTFDSLGFVDEAKRNQVKDDDFRLANASVFTSGTKYNAYAYDVTDGGAAGALVVNNKNGGSSNLVPVDTESAVVLIEKIVSTLNRHDELSYGVTYWKDGTQYTNIVAYPESFLKDAADPTSVPEAGDVMQLNIDIDGEINGFQIRYDSTKDKVTEGWEECQCMMGYCYSYDNDGIIMTEKPDGTGKVSIFSSIYLMGKTYVFNSQDKTVRKGTMSDLRAFKDCMTEASKIFVRGVYSNPATLIIYE